MFALKPTSVTTSIPSHAMESVLPTSYWNKGVVGIIEVFWVNTRQILQHSLKKHKAAEQNVDAIRFLLYTFVLLTFSYVSGRICNRKQAGKLMQL
jgi:hypothetical protein